jgi:hypothetical protein
MSDGGGHRSVVRKLSAPIDGCSIARGGTMGVRRVGGTRGTPIVLV